MGYFDMMSGWGWAWSGWVMYLGMIAFWAGVVALVIWAIRAVGAPRATPATPPSGPLAPPASALDILKRRYAAGEIDAAEFEQKRRDLA